jgi:ABC-type bacteriocin/lantibiotic exporter with double-glycine peptidase domain
MRMVLANLGVSKSEQELRELCDCTPMSGTDAWLLVAAAKKLGFADSAKHNLAFDTLSELKVLLEEGIYPIAFIRTHAAVSQYFEQHAVVIVAVDGNAIRILDPLRGECSYSIEEFMHNWGRMRYLAILIQ